MNEAEKIIQQLGLEPHPEGGYFRETYRSKGVISGTQLPSQFEDDRNYATCIYFLLTSEFFSSFHKINQDEIWHFYDGAPIELHTISPSGEHKEFLIGKAFDEGQVPQLIVPGDHWFAAKTTKENAYSLVGCTVSPGFDFNDFELAKRDKMCENFPEHEQLILSFTRS